MTTKNTICVAAMILSVLAVSALYRANSSKKDSDQSANQIDAQTPIPETTTLDPNVAMIGGIPRPISDVKLSKPAESKPKTEPTLKRQGFAPALPHDTNDETKLVATALKVKEKPERYSSFVIPNSFDLEAFKADPKGYATEYAQVIEPGRVFAPAQPSEDIKPIRAASSRLHNVKQGETVRLAIKAEPFAPISFTSQSLGFFDNKLTSTTVVADESGNANANFTAGGGTIDEVYVLAASPLNSGQITFTFAVSLPD